MNRYWIVPLAALLVQTAIAAPIALTYDSPRESKTTTTALTSSTPISLDGRLAGMGEIVDTLSFVAGSTSLSLSAGWLLAPPSNRTVGVNIDLYDSLDALVASDTFLGLDGTLATSRLSAGGLTPGAVYRLEFTGTAQGFGRYHVDLADGTVVLPIPVVPSFVPDVDKSLFDTSVGSKIFPTTLASGGSFTIDGAFDGGNIVDRFEFVLAGGTLSAGIEWVVNTIADPVRTVGVNVDVLDSFGTVVASDQFKGVTNGQAFSQFDVTGLANGSYTLEFTGLAPNARGRFHIDLSTSATAPGFVPIVDGIAVVPEPGLPALLGLGGLAFAVLRRRRVVKSPVRKASMREAMQTGPSRDRIERPAPIGRRQE